MMDEAEVAEEINQETEQAAIQKARDRANAAMWSLGSCRTVFCYFNCCNNFVVSGDPDGSCGISCCPWISHGLVHGAETG